MKTYKITLLIDSDERVENWSGWDETVAIAQAFLSHAYEGARELKILDIQDHEALRNSN